MKTQITIEKTFDFDDLVELVGDRFRDLEQLSISTDVEVEFDWSGEELVAIATYKKDV